MPPSRYDLRGVSSDKNEVHAAIRNLDSGLFKNTFCKILPQPFHAQSKRGMILHADTAGTKTILAYLYWKETGNLEAWKGIAQDALVMNLDDMACCGLTDEFVISNTILRNKKLIPGEILEAVISGTTEFIDSMRSMGIKIHHAGGETADVGDVVRTMDVGFTAYGELDLENVFVNQIQPGDEILGLASDGQTTYETKYNSGISCNGLTSARHDLLDVSYADMYPESYDPLVPKDLVYSGSYTLTDQVEGYEMGDLLLSPTRTYLPFLKSLFRERITGLHGIIHATGGGHSKVLKFVDQLHIVKNNLPPLPPIFKALQSVGRYSLAEMYKVWNMGVRLELYGSQEAIQHAAHLAASFHINAYRLGYVEHTDGLSKVTMAHEGQNWVYSA
jgi:phosphoribosylformylglycinamidine cyclo-ligase